MVAKISSGDVVTITRDGPIAVIIIDFPPVNVLSHAVRAGLHHALADLQDDSLVEAIVLICAGRTFIAGADVSEFGGAIAPPILHDIIARIEDMPKPVIAAIHGTALGGGLEVALACHHRIAAAGAKLGLPEITLGLMPGAGGTQRLPRLIGVEAALDMILTGKPISAAYALELGLVDEVEIDAPQLRAKAISYAERLLSDRAALVRTCDRDDKITEARNRPELLDEARRRHSRLFVGAMAPEKVLKAVKAGLEESFEVALALETQLFEELRASREAAARQHIFFAERAAAKIPGLTSQASARKIESVGIVGAGTMGGGIAMNFLNIGIPVTIVDTTEAGLERGVATIRRNYDASARRGALTAEQVDQRMTLLTLSTTIDALASADLVIEAVFESMAVKKDVFGKLDAIAKPEAILASNTSFLDIDEIAAATSRAGHVLGLHFFSPANVMALLEVVRGDRTDDDVLATAMALAKQIGKTPVLSRVCDGFIANRAMAPRWHQADALLAGGATPTDIDAVLTGFGFSMGHFAMMDLVGLDVVGRDNSARTIMGDLVAAGRLGQKSGGGYFDYDDKRKAVTSPAAAEIIARFSNETKTPTGRFSKEEMLQRLLYPVVNEAARILEEHIAIRASDIDVALVLGYGWPMQTGGPAFWADTVGLTHIVEKLDAFALASGDDRFTPCERLRTLAQTGASFADALAEWP